MNLKDHPKAIYIEILLAFQATSGLAGILIATLIIRRRLMIAIHLLVILFALLGAISLRKNSKKLFLIQAELTACLAMSLLIYEIISKVALNQFNSEILFLIPYIFDITISILNICFYNKICAEEEAAESGYQRIEENYAAFENASNNEELKHSTEHQGVHHNYIDLSMCCICQTSQADFAIIPCGHKCLCERCQNVYKTGGRACPICRKKIDKVVRIFE